MTLREMITRITIKEPGKLKLVNNLIHDCWFDVNRISVANNRFELHFSRYVERDSRIIRNFFFVRNYQRVDCVLQIDNVTAHEIVDTEAVQFYDLTKLVYQANDNSITFVTGVPITIKLKISKLKISVINTNSIMENKRSWSI